MGKAPASQFYWNDWNRDLGDEPLEVEGAWIRICCKLWNDETKCSATNSFKKWKKILGVSRQKTIKILQILSKNIANISPNITEKIKNSDDISILCRRMERDENARKANNNKQKAWDDNNSKSKKPNASLTAKKQKPNHPSSSSSSYKKETPLTPLEKSETAKDILETPVQTVILLYNIYLAPLGNPKADPDQLAMMGSIRHIQDRWEENPDLPFWESFFQSLGAMPQLVGGGAGGWRAPLDWIVKAGNFQKIIRGDYAKGRARVDMGAVVEELCGAIGRIDTGNLKNLSEAAMTVARHETFRINRIGNMAMPEAKNEIWKVVKGIFGGKS